MATVEKYLENKFVKWCKDNDIIAIKGPTATTKGFPDRFLQLPYNGGTVYVEFKGTSYYDLTPLQLWWKEYLMKSNPNRYFFVKDEAGLDDLIKTCEKFMAVGNAVVEYERQLLGSQTIDNCK